MEPLPKATYGILLSAMEPSKRCLLIMPFSDSDGGRSEHWRRCAQALSARIEAVIGYACRRHDLGAGHLLGSVIEALVGADLVVCDLTHLKANVVFELGMAMILEKPIILLTQGPQGIPSDFSNYTYISYSFRRSRRRESDALTFSPGQKEDLFTETLHRLAAGPIPHYSSSLGRTLRSFSTLLKHLLQLESDRAILAPAVQSLFETLVSRNTERLSEFVEKGLPSVVIKPESADILFALLTALLEGLEAQDSYDSITWRRHWMGANEIAARTFLEAIGRKGARLPRMRRIFLLGVTYGQDEWIVDPYDAQAISSYNSFVSMKVPQILNRFLALPEGLVEPVALRCHMGKITRGEIVLFVFSRYATDGSLTSFELVRDAGPEWDFEEFWQVAKPLSTFFLGDRPVTKIDAREVAFRFAGQKFSYRKPLHSVLAKLGVMEGNLTPLPGSLR